MSARQKVQKHVTYIITYVHVQWLWRRYVSMSTVQKVQKHVTYIITYVQWLWRRYVSMSTVQKVQKHVTYIITYVHVHVQWLWRRYVSMLTVQKVQKHVTWYIITYVHVQWLWRHYVSLSSVQKENTLHYLVLVVSREKTEAREAAPIVRLPSRAGKQARRKLFQLTIEAAMGMPYRPACRELQEEHDACTQLDVTAPMK